MILVFLILGLIIIINLIFYIFLLSNIKIKIVKLHIFYNVEKIDIKFISKIGLYLFNKLKLFQITIDDDKIEKLYKSGKIDINKLKDNKELNKEILKLLKNIDLAIERLKLEGYIGTKNAAFTAYISCFINAIIPIIISNKIFEYKKENYNYKIDTVYIKQNIVNLDFDCIISIKTVHIINIVNYLLKKGRVKNNERTSNRRTYAYSHE